MSNIINKFELNLNCEECKEALKTLLDMYEKNKTRNWLEVQIKDDLNAHGIKTHSHILANYVARA